MWGPLALRSPLTLERQLDSPSWTNRTAASATNRSAASAPPPSQCTLVISFPGLPRCALVSPLHPREQRSTRRHVAARCAALVADDDVGDDWDDDTFEKQRPPQRQAANLGMTELDLNRWKKKPVEEKYRIQVEKSISEDRIEDLGVYQWSTWSSPGPCAYSWEWRADEQVFISQGKLRVTPHGSANSVELAAGDLVRFPKWMLAELEISGKYEQRYRFRAYGDDN